jgi:hypothetical protein
MKRITYAGGGVFLLVALPSMLFAQAAAPAHAPDFRAMQHIAPLYFAPVPNAPFMAIAKTTWVQILPDGSTITWQNQRVVARDMDGRIFQERRTFVPVPDPTNSQSVAYVNQFDDPVAHTMSICNVFMKVCNEFAYHPATQARDTPAGLQPGGRTYLTRENLGADLIDDQEALHTRETLTVFSQTVGNTKNIIRTVDYWYSPTLNVNLKVVRHDPRDGDQTLWLTDLNLSAPDPSVFQIPSQYRIVDHRDPQPQAHIGNQ